MEEEWWREWIGPGLLLLAVGAFFSLIHQTWEYLLVMAGGYGAMLWYQWDCHRKQAEGDEAPDQE